MRVLALLLALGLIAAGAAPAAAAGKAKPLKAKASQASGGWAGQLAAYKTRAMAEKSWRAFARENAALLGGASMHVEEIPQGGAVLYRLMAAGFASRREAQQFCKTAEQAGKACIVRQVAGGPASAAASAPRSAHGTAFKAPPGGSEIPPSILFGQWTGGQGRCGVDYVAIDPFVVTYYKAGRRVGEMACRDWAEADILVLECQDGSTAEFLAKGRDEMILKVSRESPDAEPTRLEQTWRRCPQEEAAAPR